MEYDNKKSIVSLEQSFYISSLYDLWILVDDVVSHALNIFHLLPLMTLTCQAEISKVMVT